MRRAYRTPFVLLVPGLLLAGAPAIVVTTRPGTKVRLDLGPHPIAMALDAQRSRAVIADIEDGTVRVIDTRARAVVRVVTVGGRPQAVGVDTVTGHAFVVIQGTGRHSDAVSTLDTESGTVLNSALLGSGTGASAIAVDGRQRRAFVMNALSNTISILDTRRGTVLRTLSMDAATGSGRTMMSRIALDTRTGLAFVLTQSTAGPALTNRERLIMFDSKSGALARIIVLPLTQGYLTVDEATARAFVAAPTFPGQRGYVDVLNSRSGRLLHTVPVSGDGPVTVDGWTGRAFAVSLNKTTTTASVSVLNGRSGILLRTVAARSTIAQIVVDAHTGRLLTLAMTVNTSSGRPVRITTVLLLDGLTGRVLRALPTDAGDSLQGFAVEGTTGRVLLLEGPGVRPAFDRWTWIRRLLPWLPLPGPPAPENARTGSLLILAESALHDTVRP